MPLVLLATLVVVLKLPTLDTPAYWDEMGWLGQANWLSEQSLLAAIPGLRPASAFWGHPPGLHLTLAALWKLSGPSLWVAHLLIAGFAVIGIAATFQLARLISGLETGLFAALFLLLSPLYLAQSGMFLADVPVAALGVLSVYLALRNRYVPYLLCASFMVLIKETSIALLAALVLYQAFLAGPITWRAIGKALRYSVPLVVIAGFFVLQKIATGKWFFIYDFEIELFRADASAVRRQFVWITRWIFLEQGRYLLTALIAFNLIVNAAARRRRVIGLFALIGVLSGYSFSVLYSLPRYLLPVLPFFYVLGAVSLVDVLRWKWLRVPVGAIALAAMVWSLARPRFWGNGETDLSYLDVVEQHRTMADYLGTAFPDAGILTAWPLTSALGRPVFGYVRSPLRVRNYTQPADLQRHDLVVVSSPGSREMAELWKLVRQQGWRPLSRLAKGTIETELYALPARGSVPDRE